MGFSDEYYEALNKKKKKKQDTSSNSKASGSKSNYSSAYYSALEDLPIRNTVTIDDDDIAPVRQTSGGNKDSWFKSGGFSDGVDDVGDFFGDLGETIGGTAADLGIGMVYHYVLL